MFGAGPIPQALVIQIQLLQFSARPGQHASGRQAGQFAGGQEHAIAMLFAQAGTRQPVHLGVRATEQGLAVGFLRNFNKGLDLGGIGVQGKFFKDAGNGWQRSFVADQQQFAHALRWLPFIATGVVGAGCIGRCDLQAIPRPGLASPACGGAGDAVEDEVDIQFAGLCAQVAKGVGAHGWH